MFLWIGLDSDADFFQGVEIWNKKSQYSYDFLNWYQSLKKHIKTSRTFLTKRFNHFSLNCTYKLRKPIDQELF